MKFVENRNKFRILSAIIIIFGFIMYMINGFNLGIDFTGGTLIEIDAGKFIPVADVRELIEDYDKDISIIHGGDKQERLIIKSTLDLSNEEILEISQIFNDEFDISSDDIVSEKIGPSMGEEIKSRAFLSVGIATIAMLIYISIRFEFKFAVSAIIALIHDVLITISVYAIFNLPVNGSFIAAILTIVGYSINDTIVIFDRVREETRLNPRDDKIDVVNNSINHSLRRTVNTSITTITAVTILYIVGVEDIKVLALPLILGMLAGTYSSVFLAPGVWYDLEKINGKTA